MNAAGILFFVLPETILLVFALAILTFPLFVKSRGWIGPLALGAVLLASAFVPAIATASPCLFFNMLVNDAFSVFFKLICLFVTGITVLLSMGCRSLPVRRRGEYYFLLLLAAVAMMLAVSSNNLIMVYISLEMLSLVSYILVGFHKHDGFSSEGALKYFLFGALSTGIMLYGISLVYGLLGTTDLSAIFGVLRAGPVHLPAATAAFVMILAGLCFKCALVPFHLWVPDAYQGAPTPVTAFLSAGPKAAGFAVLLRLFAINFSPFCAGWTDLAALLAVLTMTVGNIIAISQTDIKRMLAYSSVAQAGYILIGFVAQNALGMEGVFYYLLAYALMNLGAFGCVVLVSNSMKSDAIDDYAGLYKRAPVPAFMLTVFLLSLAGIPPLAGFFGKFFVFAAAIQSGLFLLVLIALLNSVIAAFYYVKVIKVMYLREPAGAAMIPRSPSLQAALILLLTGVLLAGLYPLPFLHGIKISQFVFFR